MLLFPPPPNIRIYLVIFFFCKKKQHTHTCVRIIFFKNPLCVHIYMNMPRRKKNKLILKKFDITSIPDESVIVFVGKRQTGKSFLVKDLLFYKQNIPVGTVISGTEVANKFYSHIFPKIFIHNEYDEGISERVLERQKRVMKQVSKEKRYRGTCDIDPRALYILDDCIYDSSWTKSKIMRSLFMNGRHYKVMLIITMQYALGIPPNLRTNIDYIFILRESIYQNRKRIYDSYAGMFRTFDMFCRVMDQCTEDYHCLEINNNAKSNRMDDQVFWYKAIAHESFRVGHPSFWEYDSIHNPDTDDDDDFKDNDPIVVRADYTGKRRQKSGY